MNLRTRSFERMLLTPAGRRLLAARAFVIALAAALLLIPTTCAQVSGPHSIFFDTTAGHHHHHQSAESADDGFQSNAELALHVTLGDGSPSWVLDDTSDADRDCPTDPSLRELPTTMEMGSASAPMTLEILDTVEFPQLQEPVAIDEPALTAVIDPVESPPPR